MSLTQKLDEKRRFAKVSICVVSFVKSISCFTSILDNGHSNYDVRIGLNSFLCFSIIPSYAERIIVEIKECMKFIDQFIISKYHS